jgi:hypothetical protein
VALFDELANLTSQDYAAGARIRTA